jgi:PKD repeat protein
VCVGPFCTPGCFCGQTSLNATTRAATFSSSVTVGSSIVAVTISRYQIASVTDSKSNTYTKVAEKGASGAYVAVWLSANVATGGSSFTVTATSGSFSGPILLAVQEIDKFLQFISSLTGGIGPSSSPGLSPASYPAGSYTVAAFMATMGATPITSSPSGWQPRVTRMDTVQLGEAIDRVFSTLSAATITWALGSARSWVSVAAVFLEKLQANFTGTPTSGAATLTVAFTDSSTGSPTTWAWDFGDGGTSTSQNPSHDYTAAGTYTVTLSVTNGGSISSFTRSALHHSGRRGRLVGLAHNAGHPQLAGRHLRPADPRLALGGAEHDAAAAGFATPDGSGRCGAVAVAGAARSGPGDAGAREPHPGALLQRAVAGQDHRPHGGESVRRADVGLRFRPRPDHKRRRHHRGQGRGRLGQSRGREGLLLRRRHDRRGGVEPDQPRHGERGDGRNHWYFLAVSIDQRQFATAGALSTASATCSFAASVLTNSTIIVVVCSRLPVTAITDSKGNGYAIVALGSTAGQRITIAYGYATSAGASFAVTAITGVASTMLMTAQEVPNILLFDQSQGMTGLTTGQLSMTLNGRFSQTESYYTAIGGVFDLGATTASGYFGFFLGQPWRELIQSLFTSSLFMSISDGSSSWASASGPLVATGGITPGIGTVQLTAVMAVFIEDVRASFTGTPTSGAAPLSVAFTDASTGSPDHWLYEFGDGQTSSSQNPSHQYAADGTYTVRESVWRFDTPVNRQTRTNYIVVGGGGTGGGGTPTEPGIPNNPPLSPQPGYPAPPIPGSPWMAQAMIPKPPEPPAPSAPTVAVGIAPLVPAGAKASDGARQERVNRVLASIHDGMEREQQKPRDGENSFYLLGTGFDSAAAPTVSDDETIGASVGATWVHTDSDGVVTLYICFAATVGAADWRAASSNAARGIGGITGTF